MQRKTIKAIKHTYTTANLASAWPVGCWAQAVYHCAFLTPFPRGGQREDLKSEPLLFMFFYVNYNSINNRNVFMFHSFHGCIKN